MYDGAQAGLLTWSDLITLQADYNADTDEIELKIIGCNENYKNVSYIGKSIGIDPCVPTISEIK